MTFYIQKLTRACVFLVLIALGLSGFYPAVNAAELPPPLSDKDFHQTSPEKVRLGRLLFYDKILSGNKNISCATCHHHKFASADGLSLPVGEGGIGIGPDRSIGAGESQIDQRVPRNSPALFNLGAKEFEVLFHDGRVSLDPSRPTGFNTPAEEDLPKGLNNVMAAQAMFPVTSEVEMAGKFGENPVGNAANRDFEYVWPLLAKRVQAIPDYFLLFEQAFAGIKKPSDITFVHIANALADFQMSEWRADQSPFDLYLRGHKTALSPEQIEGMELFYGKAKCSRCHSGPLQTDHKFHAIAIPQIGYPITRRFDRLVRDAGRINESDDLRDLYKFRTPSLRNVAQTAPYGHSGAYRTLEGIVRHHLQPVESYNTYDRSQVILAKHPKLSKLDFVAMDNRRETKKLLAANVLEPVNLTDKEFSALITFLGALTDINSLSGKSSPPRHVPSGLSVD